MQEQHSITKMNETSIQISSVFIHVESNETDCKLKQISVIWPEEDDALGNFLLSYIQGLRRFFIV